MPVYRLADPTTEFGYLHPAIRDAHAHGATRPAG